MIVLTLILLKNFSHAAFTSSMSVPLVNGKINYKHPDFKIVSMFQKTSDGYTEVEKMPSGEEYVINSSKSFCNKGFTEEKDTQAVLKTIDGNHVMNNLTKNDRCTLYFDGLPILANDFMKGDTLTKLYIESITTLDKISIPDSAIKSWDASEANNGSVMAYYQDVDSNGKYELYLAGEGSVIAPTDSSKLFGGLTPDSTRFADVTSIDLSKLNTSRVTNMSRMFSCMDSLTSLDLSNFDTSKVTDMSRMFGYSNLINSLNLSSFDTSKVTNMEGMFLQVLAITSLDLSSFDTSKVTDMSSMFDGMNSLKSLDLSNADFSNVTDYGGMFGVIPSSQVTVKTKDEAAKAFIDARLAEAMLPVIIPPTP